MSVLGVGVHPSPPAHHRYVPIRLAMTATSIRPFVIRTHAILRYAIAASIRPPVIVVVVVNSVSVPAELRQQACSLASETAS